MSERNFTPPAGTPDYLSHDSVKTRVGEAYTLVETIVIQLPEFPQQYTREELRLDLLEVLRLLATSTQGTSE